jgi:hypothetical protein
MISQSAQPASDLCDTWQLRSYPRMIPGRNGVAIVQRFTSKSLYGSVQNGSATERGLAKGKLAR